MVSMVESRQRWVERPDRVYGAQDRARGAVFTKKPVVDLLMKLGFEKREGGLLSTRVLEPSFGHGDFLIPIARNLLTEWRGSDRNGDDTVLDSCIRGVEIDQESFRYVREKVRDLLVEFDVHPTSILRILDEWLSEGDFLIEEFDQAFDLVIGNPPYIRQEAIDDALLATYKSRFATMIGRADIYVAFFERSLELLRPNGRVAFICSDSWIKNAYGRALRSKIANEYCLRYYVDMYGLDVFDFQVGTYPSITIIENTQKDLAARVATASNATAEGLARLGADLAASKPKDDGIHEVRIDKLEGAPWLFSKRDEVSLIRQLEARLPSLEEAGCVVGIGVATGLDKVFIGQFSELDVEESRKLRLATNRDVVSGELRWSGKGVINPYGEDGSLVQLDDFPKLDRYLRPHEQALRSRHTAKKSPDSQWFRTIDKIRPLLADTPKLLVPDIRGDGTSIAFDEGTLYPHHNLYFITSGIWDLQALRALLLSGIATLFVGAYSVRIGGGYFRFQAQYLRRIRLPHWGSLDSSQRAEMAAAGRENRKLSIEFLADVYSLPESQLRKALGGGQVE